MNINPYDILGLDKKCSIDEIKTAYKTLAKIYHPDKPTGNEFKYKIITEAYNRIKTQKIREEYDLNEEKTGVVEGSYDDLKNRAQEFYKTIPVYDAPPTTMENIHETFNKKNGITGSTTRMTQSEWEKRKEELNTIRNLEDIENEHENIFLDTEYNNDVFNNKWETLHKNSKSTEIMESSGALASPWTLNSSLAYVSISDIDKLYHNDGANQYDNFYGKNYSSLNQPYTMFGNVADLQNSQRYTNGKLGEKDFIERINEYQKLNLNPQFETLF